MVARARAHALKSPPAAPRARDESAAAPLGALLLRPGAPYLLPLVVALAMRVWTVFAIPFASEDAYITFRYAENWARGLGPVYNAGERVMGFSSPLWTAWLAAGSLAFGHALMFARVSGLGLDLVALVVGTHMLERERGRASAWVFAAFFAVYPIFAANAVLGMETSLFLCLLFVAADRVALARKDAGAWLGLLALVRPEAVLCAALIALRADRRARLIALAMAAAGAAVLGAYYGSPVPQSVIAKAATYGLGGPLAGEPWIAGLVPVFLTGRWPDTGEAINLFPFALVAFPAVLLAVRALWKERAKRRATALVVLSGLAVLLGYTLVGVPYFFWYGVVPFACWGMAAAIGLPLLAPHRLLYLGLGMYLVSDAFLLHHLYVERVRQEAISFWQTGDALRRASGGKGTVLLEPLGHVGYVSGLTAWDEVGLVAPTVARRRAQGAGWYADVVATLRPDYLVVRDGFFEQNRSFAGVGEPFRSPQEMGAVRAAYDPVPVPPSAQPSGLTILRRRR